MVKYFVATTGLDTNPGTQASPFATLRKACTVLANGDEIEVGAGTYNDQETANVNGKSNFKIYGAPGGSLPVIKYRGGVNFASNAIKIVNSNNYILSGIFFQGNNPEISYNDAIADYNADKNTFDARYDMNGIVIETSYAVRILACRVEDFPGGGIGFKDCDLATADTCLIRNCTNFSKFGTQGIGFLGAVNSPGAVAGRNGLQILNCTILDCVNQIPWNSVDRINEGFGGYSDTTKQNIAKTVTYTGKFLFRGNTVHGCGGGAFNALNSCPGQIDRNFIGGNRKNVEITTGEIQVSNAGIVRILENEIITDSDRKIFSIFGDSNVSGSAFKFNYVRGTAATMFDGANVENVSNTYA